MKRKWFTVGIILLFVGTCIIPVIAQYSEPSNHLVRGLTITVDNDGDGDYTSIKDAVNSTHPGDIIEVYSGTYLEGEILMDTSQIMLKGVPYELGGGNDTGKPLIVRKGYMQIISVWADKITISGFIMQDTNSERNVLYQGHFIDVHSIIGCLISNNTIRNGTNYSVGIHCFNTTDVQIIENCITNTDWDGISFDESNNAIVCGNSISNSETGIFIDSSESINLTKNKINGCEVGIGIDGSSNITLYLNNIENNYLGLNLALSGKNIVKHNNFINNSKGDVALLAAKIVILQRWKSLRNSWIENYWDHWIKIGPKFIPGLVFILIGIIPGGEFFFPIAIPLPLFQFDRYPAQEPYNITGMT